MPASSQQPVSIAIEADQSSFFLYKTVVLTAQCGTELGRGVVTSGEQDYHSGHFWMICFFLRAFSWDARPLVSSASWIGLHTGVNSCCSGCCRTLCTFTCLSTN